MSELIPIIKTSSNINAVDGRTLHEAIQSKTPDFSTWTQRKIKKFGFVENQDYEVFFHNSVEKGRPSKEYVISLDMAKEVAMVENNAKGREIRQYFIKAEKTLSTLAQNDYTQKVLNLETQMTAVKIALDWLNASDSSKLRAMQMLFESNGLDKKLLPSYSDSKGTLLSCSELLTKNNSPVKIISFNKLLLADGFLEEKERPSSKGGVKKYKSLTKKGLEYGENLVAPENPKETAPQYYQEKFAELMNIVLK
jgi:phage anti-repressor protein